MRRHFLTVLILCVSISISASARNRVPPGFEDIRGMAQEALLVLRGKVVDVTYADTGRGTHFKDGSAVIAVDRWYRGSSSNNSVSLHFAHDSSGVAGGHDCRNLEIGGYWIVFARPGHGKVLEMVNDCDGALRVSSLVGPKTPDGFFSQMEEDFAAGLNDPDRDLRIASIQRLAALGQLRSTEALRRVITTRSEEESKWAIFAALKAGDSSFLPAAVPFLVKLHHKESLVHHEPNGFTYTEGFPYLEPEGSMALAISKLRTSDAIPSLTGLAKEAPDGLVRLCATEALREIKRLPHKSKRP